MQLNSPCQTTRLASPALLRLGSELLPLIEKVRHVDLSGLKEDYEALLRGVLSVAF